MKKFHVQRGMSIVEIAIVLVVIGLMVGGVLAGGTLVRQAQVRSVMSDVDNFRTAVYSFKSEYGYLPGDMPNATDYWQFRGGTTGKDAACYGIASSYVGTCNGDGSGTLQWNFERFLVYQHLADAGLISGQYTGSSAGANATNYTTDFQYNLGVNVPKGKIAGSAIIIGTSNMAPALNDPNYYDGPAHPQTITMNYPNSSTKLLTPSEYWSIDKKLDDGLPATGIVYGLKASSVWAPNCTTSDDASTAQYNIKATDKLCDVNLSL